MALPAILAPAAIFGAVSTAATYVVKFAKDHFFTLGLSVAMAGFVYAAFDSAVQMLIEQFMSSSTDIPERALQMMGLLGIDEALRIIFSSATGAYAFVVTSGAAQIIRTKRWERARLQRDREMIEGTAEIITPSKGSVTVNSSSVTHTEYLESFIK